MIYINFVVLLGTSIEINKPFTLENGARLIMAKGDKVNDF